jgi:FlaA1/EpsC-like NDP-sugar epimerase
MRRRIRSAAFPVHRHSLPQVLVDGFLVALAYFLAFWLRFDGYPKGRIAGKYAALIDPTIFWVIPLFLVVLAAFGVYERLWNYIGQRDYEAVGKGVDISTLLVVGLLSLLHPVD